MPRIAIAQINTIVGDISGNRDKIIFCIKEAIGKKTDIIIFPELAVTGYPPEDLILKPYFVKQNIKALNEITGQARGIAAVIGFINSEKSKVYNSAAVIEDKKIKHVYNKIKLPNYGVFDEKRYFESGDRSLLYKSDSAAFALSICEDIWKEENAGQKKTYGKADFLINISASPYYIGKNRERMKVLRGKARKYKLPVIYCNLVGGQDELIFDGRSVVLDSKGTLTVMASAFKEELFFTDIDANGKCSSKPNIRKEPGRLEEIYSALVLGTRDFIRKNGFNKAVLGLSGGIDSALSACIAKDALGRANVLALSMPSRYSSKETQDDSRKIAGNLGIRFTTVPVDSIFDSYNESLAPHFAGMPEDIAEENIQARIRGNILMAFSNKFGYLVLNTGNKSEASVGYCTLYGDMVGGFAVIRDLTKNTVYKLSEYVNRKENREVIPESVIQRAPSAELKPGQKDQDSLPPYDIVDKIVDMYVEENKSIGFMAKKTGNRDVVKKVARMIDFSEYKRRQSPPGIKITPKAFGKDRRMPITNKFHGE